MAARFFGVTKSVGLRVVFSHDYGDWKGNVVRDNSFRHFKGKEYHVQRLQSTNWEAHDVIGRMRATSSEDSVDRILLYKFPLRGIIL